MIHELIPSLKTKIQREQIRIQNNTTRKENKRKRITEVVQQNPIEIEERIFYVLGSRKI